MNLKGVVGSGLIFSSKVIWPCSRVGIWSGKFAIFFFVILGEYVRVFVFGISEGSI